ncbi:unnamed protein product [Orchesella dallaii]|uniref:27 kDa hemolymph protein n=1 Tax=Orchesella dallaii TaxID=48710 RepID=A0ABP1Q4X5_9HEXA
MSEKLMFGFTKSSKSCLGGLLLPARVIIPTEKNRSAFRSSSRNAYGCNERRDRCEKDERNLRNFNKSTYSTVFYNLVIVVIIVNIARTVDSATVENLDSKIKMFLESHCTMQNQTLEHEEFKSFMSCGPSHGAGIVKNLGHIPEYKSDDMEQWTKATKREIVSQCEIWPQDRQCQERTFGLIEKCFDKDQKFIFYFMFALTDVICQRENDMFVKFWQSGGDACLGKHIKSLKKDFSDCFTQTSTMSNADVYRNFDEVMQCFKSQFEEDCYGEGTSEVLNEILAEIKRVYRGSAAAGTSSAYNFSAPFLLAGWMTFLGLVVQSSVLQL